MPKKQLKNRRLHGANGSLTKPVWDWLRRSLAAFISALGMLSLLAFLLYFGLQSVAVIMQRPVAEVSVESNFNYVRRQQLMELLNTAISQGFLYENLHGIKAELEQNAWIDKVVLSRRWPDHVHVKIAEQVPIARWTDTGFINYRGELVVVSDTRRLQHLPRLAGPVEDSVEILNQYQAISKLLRKYDLEIVDLTKSQHHRWTMELANGWQINIGKGQIMEKMQRFATVLKDQLLAHRNAVAIVDMRYQHGLAVRWLHTGATVSALPSNKRLVVEGI